MIRTHISTLVVLFGLGVAAASADWTDNFDGAAFNGRWGEDEPNTANGEVTLDTVNDTAHFTAYATLNMWGSRDDAPILWTPAPAGNYMFETHVSAITGPNGTQAGIVIYSTDGSIPNFIFCLDHWSASHVVKFQGVGDNNPNVSVSATGGEAWLRLKVMRDQGAGGVDRYVAQYKLNMGDPWSTLHTYDINTADARVGLAFKTSGGGRTADFSYAKMTEIPTSFTDNFDGTVFDDRWGEDEPNPALGTVSLDTGNDYAHFASLGSINMWTARASAPILWVASPSGSFSIATHVTMPLAQDHAQAGLTVYSGDNGLPNFVYCLDQWVAATHRVRLQKLGGGAPDVGYVYAGGEAWLRLVLLRDGGAGGVDRYVCQYKVTVDAPWTTLTTYDADIANARAGLFLKADSAGKTADMSYVTVRDVNGIAGGDVIKLDFSTAGDGDGGSVFDWNQVGATGATIPVGRVVRHGDAAIVDGVAIAFANFVSGNVNNDGNSANWGGTAADPYYILAADDIYFHGSANDLSVTFSGLDSVLTYEVRIYSMIGNNAGVRERFVVTDGAGTQTVQNTRGTRWGAATLMSAGTHFTGISPNGSGEVTVTVEDVDTAFYPLNAIVLEANTPSQGTLFMLQ